MVTLEFTPQKKRWTAEELLAMDKAGLLDPEKRVELLDGEVYETPSTGEPHADIVDILAHDLILKFGGRARVRVQNPVALSQYSLPLPDMALVQQKSYSEGHPKPEEIFLVIEVADTTLKYDRGKKLSDYAEEYLTRFVVKPGEAVAPLAFPDDPVTPL